MVRRRGSELEELVDECLRSLTPRQEQVVRMRFGIGCEEMTLAQVGKNFGVTRERIRQIEMKSLRILRHPSKSRKINDYLSTDEGKRDPVLLSQTEKLIIGIFGQRVTDFGKSLDELYPWPE